MPELPEVDGFRALIERVALGRRIVRARALDDWMVKDTTPQAVSEDLSGRTIGAVERRGKIVLLFVRRRRREADPPALALHFGMTGHPVEAAAGEPVHRWDRLVLRLAGAGELRYRNSRRLGFIRVLPRSELTDLLWGLGPDPLEAPADYLRDGFAIRRATVKAVLLDQAFLAGVGNIYADEALFAAGVRPDRQASSLLPAEATELHRELRAILRRAVRAAVAGRTAAFPLAGLRGRAARNLALTGTAGVGCPRCGGELGAMRIAGRTSYHCRSCQH